MSSVMRNHWTDATWCVGFPSCDSIVGSPEMIGERLHYTRRRVKAGVRLKSLRVEATEIKRYSAATHVRELREAKFLPRELTFRWSIFFWDDTIAFFSPPAEGIAWTVESKTLRATMQQLFDLLWSVSRRMETA